ncbi:holin [Serratia proteamaculans]|uniref:Holin n=1 Tax=Serratia proteamaculans TaxID=28151 RepID=A0A5Q2V5I4_SERPR|nr:holin [Serratia proteamaculans]QGH60752.1 holin [Serratia proteamaculans]
MPNGETTLFAKLVLIGALIGAGQLLVGQEQITARLFIGRVILGSAVSLVSGVALIQMGDIPDLAVIGIACMLGIAGHTAVEAAAQRWLKSKKDKTP